MNTQTFAHTQDFTAITDEQLMAVNGGDGIVNWKGAAFNGGQIFVGGQRYTPGVPPNLTFLMQHA